MENGDRIDSLTCNAYCRNSVVPCNHDTGLKSYPVERYNRTLMDGIRRYVDNHVNSWDKRLGILACALQSAVNRHTGYPESPKVKT